MPKLLELARKMVSGAAPQMPIGRLLGFRLTAIEPGQAVCVLPVDERHHNPLGTLHGGVYCDLADAAMGLAYAATLADGETFTTVELKINYLRAVRQATLTAEARLVKGGGTIGYLECEVKDEAGRLVAKAAQHVLEAEGEVGFATASPVSVQRQLKQPREDHWDSLPANPVDASGLSAGGNVESQSL